MAKGLVGSQNNTRSKDAEHLVQMFFNKEWQKHLSLRSHVLCPTEEGK